MTSQFAFRGSPPNQSTISTASNSPPPAQAGMSGGAGGVSGAARPSSPAAAPRCCDTGRPIFQDPITGQTVCSCQYEFLNYQRLASGVPLSMYSAPYSDAAAATAAGMAAYFPALAADQPPFYPNAAAGIELKENLAASAASWPYPTVYHPYDAAFAGYPFNGYGMDLNGARRKNATRETTSTLKAWLNEHKKNPYPTKGEKIMLAIITKMTLTQVSTWFANARRRLKKENKMTWEPKNKTDDDDDTMLSDEEKDKDEQDEKIKTHKDEERKGDDMLQGMHHQLLGYGIKEESKRGASDCGVPIPASKPKIWSLADTAACKTPPPAAQPWPQHSYGPERAAAADGSSNGFALPATAAASPASGSYGRYGGFPGGQYGGQHPCVHPAAFPDVQTDTPPQTPPNMKVPSVANPLGSGGGSGYCFPRHQQSPQRDAYHNPHHGANSHQPNQPHHNEGSAAFKPFYKR